MSSIRIFSKKKKPIVMVTAYDYVSAKTASEAGINALLVGDSLGMVYAGDKNTIKVTLEQMILHSRYVRNGAPDAFIITDMPFLTYKITPSRAIINAGKMITEGNADAVKVEGGTEICRTVKKLIQADIPVMGHLGLTPQGILKFGKYRKVGKGMDEKKYLLRSALDLAAAGVFSIVLESIPEEIGTEITRSINIPTIGIGAGRHTDGQILVWNDVLGFYDRLRPRFSKQYKDLWNDAIEGLKEYKREIEEGKFPSEKNI